MPKPASPRLVRVRPQKPIDDLLRRIIASVDRGDVKLITGRFRPVKKGRPLTWQDKVVGLVLLAGLGLAIWLHARPAPVSAHATYYRTLALSTGGDVTSARSFVETALGSIGSQWKPGVLFAYAHPLFWDRPVAADPNMLVKGVEDGLARLAVHGSVLSASVFNAPALVTETTPDGGTVLTWTASGQIECSDGAVLRFSARLIQDGKSQKWGIAGLSIPSFLP
jgi:hypothetical protein